MGSMCFKKLRCDEEQGAAGKTSRKRRTLRDQADCWLEQSYSHMSISAFKRQISEAETYNFPHHIEF